MKNEIVKASSNNENKIRLNKISWNLIDNLTEENFEVEFNNYFKELVIYKPRKSVNISLNDFNFLYKEINLINDNLFEKQNILKIIDEFYNIYLNKRPSFSPWDNEVIKLNFLNQLKTYIIERK